MKVISRAVPPIDRVWTGTCRSCNSVMEETEGNIRNPKYDQRDGRASQEICPVCGAEFWMYPKQPVRTRRNTQGWNSFPRKGDWK